MGESFVVHQLFERTSIKYALSKPTRAHNKHFLHHFPRIFPSSRNQIQESRISFSAPCFFSLEKTQPLRGLQKTFWLASWQSSINPFIFVQPKKTTADNPTRNGVFNSLSKGAFLSAPFKMRSCTSWILPFTQAWRIILEQRNGNDYAQRFVYVRVF